MLKPLISETHKPLAVTALALTVVHQTTMIKSQLTPAPVTQSTLAH